MHTPTTHKYNAENKNTDAFTKVWFEAAKVRTGERGQRSEVRERSSKEAEREKHTQRLVRR